MGLLTYKINDSVRSNPGVQKVVPMVGVAVPLAPCGHAHMPRAYSVLSPHHVLSMRAAMFVWALNMS